MKMDGALPENGFKLVKGWEFQVFERVKSQETGFSPCSLSSFQAMSWTSASSASKASLMARPGVEVVMKIVTAVTFR